MSDRLKELLRSRSFYIIIIVFVVLIFMIWLHYYEESLKFDPSDMTLEEQTEFIQQPANYDEDAVISHYDEYAIMKTVRYLGRKKEVRAVPALLRVLEQRRARYLAAEAAWALGEIGDPRAIRPLIYRINYAIGDIVNFESRQALLKFGEEAVPELISALQAKKAHQRYDIINLLGLIGDERALKPLATILLYGEQGESDDAGNSLEGIGTPSFPVFVKGLDSHKVYVQRNSVSGLGGIEWPIESTETIRKIENLLKHPHEGVRAQAARALGRKRIVSSCPQIKKAVLSEKDHNARKKMNWAINVLGKCE